MPKMKSHSGAKKRFKRSASGKLRGKRANSSHNLEHKSSKRRRNMRKPSEIAPADTRRVNKMLGGKRK
jgi:large subunit ribosomal protein L35